MITVGALLSSFVAVAGAMAAMSGSLLPVADGAYTAWTPKTGTVHYAMVDETPCNGTADYTFTNTVGVRDSYAVSLASIPNGATITDIALTPCASRNKNGAGSATMNVFYRLDGADSADAGSYELSGTTPTQLAATTFTGLSIVKNASTTLESGAVYSSGTKGARLSRLETVLTYTVTATTTPQ